MVASGPDKSIEVGINLIAEIMEDGYDLRIESHQGQLECRVSISVHDLDKSISPAELIGLLKRYDVADALDLEQLAIFCTEAANGHNPTDFLLATGRLPIHGKDGFFELFVDTGEKEIELKEDDLSSLYCRNPFQTST